MGFLYPILAKKDGFQPSGWTDDFFDFPEDRERELGPEVRDASVIPEEPEVVSSGDSLELKRCLVVAMRPTNKKIIDKSYADILML